MGFFHCFLQRQSVPEPYVCVYQNDRKHRKLERPMDRKMKVQDKHAITSRVLLAMPSTCIQTAIYLCNCKKQKSS